MADPNSIFTVMCIAVVIGVFVFLVAHDWWVKRGRARYRAYRRNKRNSELNDPYERELDRLFEAQFRDKLHTMEAMRAMLRESMRFR
jgi:hypothetical protein